MNYGGANGSPVMMLAYWAFVIVAIVALWKVYVKAGQPGWAALVPVYSYYIFLKIAGRPGWWLLWFLVPIFGPLVVSYIVSQDIAKAFGKSATFGALGLWLFGFVGILILGFGEATYTKPAGADVSAAA